MKLNVSLNSEYPKGNSNNLRIPARSIDFSRELKKPSDHAVFWDRGEIQKRNEIKQKRIMEEKIRSFSTNAF